MYRRIYILQTLLLYSKVLGMFNIVCNLVNSFWKDRREILLNKNTKQHCGKTMSTYWHQKTINRDPDAAHELFVAGYFDLLAPPSSFIRFLHDTMLLNLGFDMSKNFESSREKPL